MSIINEQLRYLRKRYEVGIESNRMLYEAQAASASLLVNSISDKKLLDHSLWGIQQITGLFDYKVNNFDEMKNLNLSPPQDIDQLKILALKLNKDVQIADFEVELKRVDSSIARTLKHPKVTARVSYGNTSTDSVERRVLPTVNTIPSSSNTDQLSFSLNISVPIFAGGSYRANKEMSAYQEGLSIEKSRAVRERVISEILKHSSILVQSDTQEELVRGAILVSKESVRWHRNRFEAGLSSIDDLVLAQKNTYDFERQYQDIKFDQIYSHIYLKFLTGSLSPKDLRELDMA